MKLSEPQKRTLGLMAEGWELHTTSGPDGSAFLSFPTAMGYQSSNISTVHALSHRRLIVRVSQNAGGSLYKISSAGRAALSEDG